MTKVVLRNTIYNLAGLGVPLLVAIIAIPSLIKALGAADFGILTLIWTVVSYLGLFDLGLGRALTLQLATTESREEVDRASSLAVTALSFLFLVGVAVGAALYFSAGALVSRLEAVSDRNDVTTALRTLSWSIPAITVTSGLRGILEAWHAFGIVNAIRLPMGIFTFAGPMFVVWFLDPKLESIALVLVIGRWIGCFAHMFFVSHLVKLRPKKFLFDAREIGPLLMTGGWLTVSNILSALMGYADRFIIAAIVSAAAVAYYATPYEIVTKLWIVPFALTAVLFPTFASKMVNGTEESRELFRRSVLLLGWVLLPICAFLAIFAHEILFIWIGSEFAENSAPLLRVFALGILINSLAHIPSTLIQSAGRAKWTVLIQLSEMLPFMFVLWWSAVNFGILGAGIAWLVRIVVDTVIMFCVARSILCLRYVEFVSYDALKFAILTSSVFAFSWVGSLSLRILGAAAFLGLLVWIALRDPAVQDYVGRVRIYLGR